MELISKEELRDRMYHEAFEVDSEMQKWESGCWIRYKLFEKILKEVPTTESRPKGEWIVSKEDSNFNCSICGCNPRKDFRASSLEWIREINGCDMQYCPWCGAEMER